MGARFIGCDRDQVFLMPPSLRDWVPEGHLVWTVLEAVGELDLSAIYADYRDDGRGRPAYEPSLMVALLLYAYARGIRSSRGIERACVEDVAFRVDGGVRRVARVARISHSAGKIAISDIPTAHQNVCPKASASGAATRARTWSGGPGTTRRPRTGQRRSAAPT